MPAMDVQLVRFGSFIVNVGAISYIGFNKNSSGDKRAEVHLNEGQYISFYDKLSPDVYAALEELREILPTIQGMTAISRTEEE